MSSVKGVDFEIWTDGACWPNPGPGGWAAIVNGVELTGSARDTTNNRMEMMGVIAGIESTPVGARLLVVSDSQYVVNGATSWMHAWKRKAWKRGDGLVKNADLWQRLDSAVSARHVRFRWVRGHSGIAQNERADQLAAAAVPA